MRGVPVIILGGPAGSGKDTVANFLVQSLGAVAVAQADPMKRFCAKVFGFTTEQLWGPSECRNAPDPNWECRGSVVFFDDARYHMHVHGRAWLAHILHPSGPELDDAAEKLADWFDALVKDIYTYNKPFTPRYALQTLGTEFGRVMSQNIWVDYARRQVFDLLGGGYRYDKEVGCVKEIDARLPGAVVIVDGRFSNEIIAVKSYGGYAIKVDMPAEQNLSKDAQAAGVQGHASETSLQGIPNHWWDAILVNDKSLGLDYLQTQVRQCVEVLLGVAAVPHVEVGQ